MTHKERVLSMLKAAGERGVRSDVFYREFMGRGVARIKDLRNEGYEISSQREGKYVRYVLVGTGGDGEGYVSGGRGACMRPAPARAASPSELAAGPSLAQSGNTGAQGGESPTSQEAPSAPQLFDPSEARSRPLSAFTDSEWETAA